MKISPDLPAGLPDAIEKTLEAHAQEVIALYLRQRNKEGRAKAAYDEAVQGSAEPDAIERLRFYCSCAMFGRDWLDAQPFFDDLVKQVASQPEQDVLAQADGPRPGLTSAVRRLIAAVNRLTQAAGKPLT